MEKKEILSVKSLDVEAHSIYGYRRILSNVNFSLSEGEIVGITGVNGAGKSTFASVILGLINKNFRITNGSIKFNGKEMLEKRVLRDKLGRKFETLVNIGVEKLRGKEIMIVMQEPLSYLDPLLPVGYQISESVILNNKDRLVNRIRSRQNIDINRINKFISYIDDHSEKEVYNFVTNNFDQYLGEQIINILRRDDLSTSDKKNMILSINDRKLNGVDKFIFDHPILGYLPFFGHRLRRIINSEGNRLALEILNLIGVYSNILDLYPNQLSGGMLQSVMIAIGLINNPKIVILDEPSSSIDPIAQYKMFQQLSKFSKEFNLALVLISHDITLLEKFTDKIGVMDNGTFVEFDDSKEIISHPKHESTKKLIENSISI